MTVNGPVGNVRQPILPYDPDIHMGGEWEKEKR
jgi:hypothetical protein